MYPDAVFTRTMDHYTPGGRTCQGREIKRLTISSIAFQDSDML